MLLFMYIIVYSRYFFRHNDAVKPKTELYFKYKYLNVM